MKELFESEMFEAVRRSLIEESAINRRLGAMSINKNDWRRKVLVGLLKERCSTRERTVFVTNTEVTVQEMTDLSNKGYDLVRTNRIIVPADIVTNELSGLAYTLEMARRSLVTDLIDRGSEGWYERLANAQRLFHEASDELGELYEALGVRRDGDLVRAMEPIYYSDLYNPRMVSVVHDHGAGVNKLRINIERISLVADKASEMKGLIQMYMIARRASAKSTESQVMMAGQSVINDLLERVMARHCPSGFGGFGHESRDGVEIERFWANWERKVGVREAEFEDYCRLTGEFVAVETLEELTKKYAGRTEGLMVNALSNNLFQTTDGRVARVIKGKNGELGKLLVSKFESLPVVGRQSGNKYRRFGDLLVMECPDINYAKLGSRTFFAYEGAMYMSDDNMPLESMMDRPLRGLELKFVKRYAYIRQNDEDDQARMNEVMTDLLDKCEIHYDDTREPQETKLGDGFVSTPLPVSYGEGVWDDPVRLFQDIVQNHLDAGVVSIRYCVQRDGSQAWVDLQDVLENDVLLGVEFEDDGQGYAPESARVMGKSGKNSPLEAGKYGEGLKMLLAAASRNLIELTLESSCLKDGKLTAWTAKAGVSGKVVVKGGQRQVTELTGFNLEFGDTAKTGSRTRVMFKDTETRFYQDCVDTLCETRFGGGNEGLERYVRKLRAEEPGAIKVGPVTYLPDEVGAVYENGLKLTRGGMLHFGGFDTPSISRTRERNDADQWRLAGYINFFLGHVSDREFARRVVGELVEWRNFPRLWKDWAEANVDVREVIGGNAYDFPNRGLYMSEVGRELPRGYLGDSSRNGHLDPDNAVNLDNNGLVGEIFPTEEEVMEDFMEVPVRLKKSVEMKVVGVVASIVAEIEKRVNDGQMTLGSDALIKLRTWKDKQFLAKAITCRRVGAASGEAHGSDRISLSEHLLEDGNLSEFMAVVMHELAHILTGGKDYTPEFMSTLLEMVMGMV